MKKMVITAALVLCASLASAITFTWDKGGDTMPSGALNGNMFTSSSTGRIALEVRDGKAPTTAFNAIAVASSVKTNSNVNSASNRADVPIYISVMRGTEEVARSLAAVMAEPNPAFTTGVSGNNNVFNGSIYQFAFAKDITLQSGDRLNFVNANGEAIDILIPVQNTEDAAFALNRSEAVIDNWSAYVQYGTATNLPEPTVLALLALGVAGVALKRKVA